jgi:PEP-CTERM motif
VTFFSSGELHYDIEITGPTSDVWVDVSGRTIIGPSGNAELRVSGDELLNGTEPSLSFDFQLLLATGSVIPVQLNAAALAFVEESGSSSSSAYIDPYFTIDPSNTNADEYSILVSPGVGNSPSGAPEPSTWAMLLLGFAGLSFAGYRKRKTKNELTAFAA